MPSRPGPGAGAERPLPAPAGLALLALATVLVGHCEAANVTAYQAAYIGGVYARAKGFSSEARPAFLAALGDPVFRRELRSCCPDLAGLPAAALATRVRAEINVAESLHNFDAVATRPVPGHHSHGDVTLDILQDTRRFLNLWELQYLGLNVPSTMEPETLAEESLFHLSPFHGQRVVENQTIGFPATREEATQRPIYIALNVIKADVGNVAFGDVSAVFNDRLTHRQSFLVPMDTGLWEFGCNASAFGPGGHNGSSFKTNCNVTAEMVSRLGSFQDLDHVILAAVKFWASDNTWQPTLARLIGRLLASSAATSIVVPDLMHYWEANLEASPVISDIKFLIGNYRSLFGTETGRRLQTFCSERGIVLQWALGPKTLEFGNATTTYAVPRRIVDPLVLPATAAGRNISSLSNGTAFAASWSAVGVARNATTTLPAGFWSSAFANSSAAVPSDYLLLPLNAGACASPQECVGMAASGACVCYDR